MNKHDVQKVIGLLREKADINKLVVFVGAGVSRNVPGMPSWNDLVKEMARSIGYSKCNTCRYKSTCIGKCPLINDFTTDDYLKIPQYVYNYNEDLYWDIIKRSIITDSFSEVPLSNAIFDIRPNHIITTNYDQLLESSSSSFIPLYDVIVSDKDLINAGKSKYILKMHGDICNPKTIVLKEQDYLDYSQTHVLIELFIKSLITDHVFLFLGYSLNDYNVKMIISWINYLRSQNQTISDNRYIGYMVLDEDKVDKKVISYFRRNNIKVLNINDFPLTKDMPSTLTDLKGKRLYSFLRVISNPGLEMEAFPDLYIENAVTFLKEHKIYDYKTVLQKLHINAYNLYDGHLMLYNNIQYQRLKDFICSGSDKIDDLYQLLANAGIKDILLNRDRSASIAITKESNLLTDSYYSAYIQNDYIKLVKLCESCSDCFMKYFFLHFIYGYNNIPANELINKEKSSIQKNLIQLYNTGIISIAKNEPINVSKVVHYVDNIPSKSIQQAYQYFKDICCGNDSRRLDITEALNELKNNVQDRHTIFFGKGGSISALYKIKNYTLAHYYFYYANHLFSLGIRDVSSFFRPYIEGIICANSDDAGKPYNDLGMKTGNHKYQITPIDIDIMTKYISTKDLDSLFTIYKVSQLCASSEVVEHTVQCYINLIKAIIAIRAYGDRDSTLSTISNLSLILMKYELSDNQKNLLSTALQNIFSDSEFNFHLWNNIPDNKAITKQIARLCALLQPSYGFSCVNSIISSPNFYNAIESIGVYTIRTIIESFLPENEKFDIEITKVIDCEKEISKKIILLRLFYHRIRAKKAKKEYMFFLSSHFASLDIGSIYEFVFGKWLIPSQNDISILIKDILKLKRKGTPGLNFFPDPVDTKLECIYILYISGFITDITELDELSSQYPHLMFLLHSDSFDYTNVDFSNYMWENFARQPQYMRLFIQHKKELVPKIQQHMKQGKATEAEKKILYGYLLSKKDFWKNDEL